MNRVLVTGASGFIGRACLEALAARTAEVHGVVRSTETIVPRHVQMHPVDLLNPQQVLTLLAQVQPACMLHLAWVPPLGENLTSKLNVEWVGASLHLLKAFADVGGKRVVMAGSCAEYDWSAGVCSELTTPLRPATLYGTCKNALHSVVESFGRQVGLSTAWARVFFVYGPYEHPNRLVPSVIHAILAGQPAPCTMGTQQRDWLYVADVADALVSLLFSEVQGAVNIGSGGAIAVRDMVGRIADLLRRPDLPQLGALPTRQDDPPLIVADVARLKSKLRWSPRFELDEGLGRTIDWWAQQLVDSRPGD